MGKGLQSISTESGRLKLSIKVRQRVNRLYWHKMHLNWRFLQLLFTKPILTDIHFKINWREGKLFLKQC